MSVVSGVGRVGCRARFPTRGEIVGGRPCAPRLGRTGSHRGHCSICATRATRDTTLSPFDKRALPASSWGGLRAAEGGARGGGVAFEVGGRPGLGASSRGSTIAGGLETPCAGILGPSILVVDGYELVVGRVERGAFASALSGFGVVPVHPPSPYAARIRRPSRAR